MTSHSQRDSINVCRGLGPILLIISITLVTGAVYGRLTQRWGPVADLVAAARHLEDFPKQLGDWQLVSERPIEESTVRMLSCAGYVNRQYVNRKTGQTLWMAVMLGPAGPIAVHTPEVCYSSRAYHIQDPRTAISLTDSAERAHTFWSVSFRGVTPSADQLHVCYAWHAKTGWEASTSPRFEFAGEPLLFKLQIAALVPIASQTQAADPCQAFLSALLRSDWKISG